MDGNGLVYEPGKKIHAFTSPIGVLLPALCYWLTGRGSYQTSLWLFRILFCIPAFVIGGIYAIKTINIKYTQQSTPLIIISLLYLFDAKIVMFSINGMETAFMLSFLGISIYLLMLKDFNSKWIFTGIVWGGLMWTRPDSCFYIAAIIATVMLFSKDKKRTATAVIKASAITALIYLPWFTGAWIYYGTPIPHTVFAKSAITSFSITDTIYRLPFNISGAFEPVYGSGGWPSSLTLFARALALFCFFYWMLPMGDPFGKKLSFLFCLLSFYFALMAFPYPWYYPPLTMLGYFIIVNGVIEIFMHFRKFRFFSTILLSVIVFNIFTLFLMEAYRMKMQQELVETGLRKQVGLWLKEHVDKNDTVYLECLGYIGYFSNAHMLDYPGLATPESVKYIKEKGCNFITLIAELKPQWTVLRPGEAELAEKNPFFSQNYRYVCHLSAVRNIEKAGYIPGVSYLYHDATFCIYRKTAQNK